MAVWKEVLRNLTFANQLTFLRLIAIPFFIIAVLTNRPGIALALFVAAAVTDWFDGLIARFLKQMTALGAFLDPVADKLLLTSAFICLTIPDHPKLLPAFEAPNHVPIQLTILTISRDTFIVMTSIILYFVYGITRFPPTIWGKITTCSEMVTIAVFLLHNVRGEESGVALAAAWGTLTLVVASGFHYIYRCSVMIREAQRSVRASPDRMPLPEARHPEDADPAGPPVREKSASGAREATARPIVEEPGIDRSGPAESHDERTGHGGLLGPDRTA